MEKEIRIAEIDNQITILKEDRENCIVSGGRDMVRAYQDAIDIKNLEMEKYDLIHGTHTKDIYDLNTRLYNEKRRCAMASTVNKKHYYIRIRSLESKIKELEEIDKNLNIESDNVMSLKK